MVRRRTRGVRAAAGSPRTAATRSVAPAPGQPAGSAQDLEALAVSHWFDSGEDGDPYTATVRFRGQRLDVRGKPGPTDAFVRDEQIRGVVPGSGPVSVTSRVYGLEPGEWTVTAELIPTRSAAPKPTDRKLRSRPGGATLPRASWSWRRWSMSSGEFRPVTTRWAPLVRLVSPPAVIPGSWTGLVALGAAIGLVIQAALLRRADIPGLAGTVVTLVALAIGLAAAKVRYIMLHPRTWRTSPAEGWAVGGFLVALPLAVLAGLLLLRLPVGAFVDASTPALFFGVAIGRLGCFFTGCCAGRCTRSRWGIWSSDRRVGARRIPTQLLESAVGLILGIGSLGILLLAPLPVEGLTFLGAMTAYFAARWRLLKLRLERQPAP